MSDIPNYDYTVVGCDCLQFRIRLKGPADSIVDLTGYAAELEIAWDGQHLLIESPELEIEAEDGIVGTTLIGAVVATLPQGRVAQHRWTLIEPGGCRRSVLQGFIERV